MGKSKITEEDQEMIDYFENHYGYDLLKEMKLQADSLERYLDLVDTFEILEGMTEETYAESKKKTKELIKYLRKGRCSKCYNKERLEEYVIEQKDMI